MARREVLFGGMADRKLRPIDPAHRARMVSATAPTHMWKIDHRPYRLPFLQTVRTAHGPWGEREGFLLRANNMSPRARSDEQAVGQIGWGEVAPIPWFGTESMEAAEQALTGLRGEAENEAHALSRVPDDCPSVRAGVAAAFAAAVFAMPRLPPASGGGRVNALPVAALLPAGRRALAAVTDRLELGFRTFKWKVGVGHAADEWALLDDLLGALPAGAKLRLDANGGWDRRTATRWLERAAERPIIEYIEQPCLAEPGASASETRKVEDTLRGLAEDYPVKIALDESLSGAGDVARWLAADWRGVWVIKPALLDDAATVLAALAKARADVVFGSALETCVGARHGLRLAFAWAEERAAQSPAAGAAPAQAPRALGYGVWPLFQEAHANGGPSGAFVRREDIERINPESLWSVLN